MATTAYQILYRSQAHDSLTPEGIRSILEVSRRKNSAAGISGLLILRDGHFLQILEGPEAVVKSVVKRIEQDPRHTNFEILYESAKAERLFGDWTMGYLDPTSPSATLPISVDTLFGIYAMSISQNRDVAGKTIRAIVDTFRKGCGDLSAANPVKS